MEGRRHLRFWLVALLVFLGAVYLLRSILLPFVVAMAVAYFLDPLCDWLDRRGMSRTWSTVAVTGLFSLAVIAVLMMIGPLVADQLISLAEKAPAYLDFLQERLSRIIEYIAQRVDPETIARAKSAAGDSAGVLIGWATGFLEGLIETGFSLANALSLLFITPVVCFYLLRDWDAMVARIDSLLPLEHAETIREQLRLVDRTLAGFVRGTASVCLLLGTFYSIGLTLAGLEFGLIVGILAGLLTFIPYVGSITGGVLSVGLALIQFDDWVRVLIVAAVFGVGQAIEGNYLTPKLVGGRVGLHPVWVIFALLAGGALFGFVGVLLAVPVAAVIGVGARFAVTRYQESRYYAGERDDGGPSGAGPTS
jgi:predicted PurR-regulated permease PerM